MKKTAINISTLIVASLLSWSNVQAQTAEVTANLLSTIQRQANGTTGDVFQLSFGSLNGGLASLLTKDSSANGAAGFASWYASNSRTLLNWGPVTGSAITDSNTYYKYYGEDTEVSTRAGGPLNSVWSSTLDNRALAFVSYSDGTTIQEVGLYDLGFSWTSPTSPIALAFGLSENFTLSADQMTAIYGAANGSALPTGALTTSSVPEPSSISLMLFGATALVALRRLRKNV
jgi:hypothetical protein